LGRLAIHFEYDSTFQHVDEPRRWMSMPRLVRRQAPRRSFRCP
jgi:hypothetical protein